MSIVALKTALVWCIAFNFGVLLIWIALVTLVHDAVYRINARVFRISVNVFDNNNYTGIIAYKAFILFFNVAPYVALVLSE